MVVSKSKEYMKRSIINSYIAAVLIAAVAYSCADESRIDYLDENAPPPAQVSNVEVMPTAGGAVITYDIPSDPNLLYVIAEYEIQPGVIREAKASIYTDSLFLVGYGDTLSHDVQLFSVGKNEKRSDPLAVSVRPLTPPVQATFGALELNPTFGGIEVRFANSAEADLAIVLMTDTTGQGDWGTVQTFYTGAAEGRFVARGFDTLERDFSAFVRDRWNNKSDTMVRTISPFFEEMIPKDTWQALNLPTDTYQSAENAYPIERLWDDDLNLMFASTNSSVQPQWFTIDLGVPVAISRIVAHQPEPVAHFYDGSGFKKFEIWGSNSPDPNGSWDSWQLMGTFESFKPSGLPQGEYSEEDRNYGWIQGEDFTFEQENPPVRYLRWKTLESYGSAAQVAIAEIDVWGRRSE